jgi:hypothetical protein
MHKISSVPGRTKISIPIHELFYKISRVPSPLYIQILIYSPVNNITFVAQGKSPVGLGEGTVGGFQRPTFLLSFPTGN